MTIRIFNIDIIIPSNHRLFNSSEFPNIKFRVLRNENATNPSFTFKLKFTEKKKKKESSLEFFKETEK